MPCARDTVDMLVLGTQAICPRTLAIYTQYSRIPDQQHEALNRHSYRQRQHRDNLDNIYATARYTRCVRLRHISHPLLCVSKHAAESAQSGRMSRLGCHGHGMGDATCQPRLGGGERNTRSHAYYIHIWRLIATILNSTDRPKRRELALVLSNFTCEGDCCRQFGSP